MSKRQLEPASKYIQKKLSSDTLRFLFEQERAKTEIARIVRTAREHAGFSQRELARKAKTTQAVVARLELGHDRRMPSLALIARLLHAAGARLELVCRFDGAA